MWYLLIVMSAQYGGPSLTSQTIPMGSEASCIERMKEIDKSILVMQKNASPEIRALCIKGAK